MKKNVSYETLSSKITTVLVTLIISYFSGNSDQTVSYIYTSVGFLMATFSADTGQTTFLIKIVNFCKRKGSLSYFSSILLRIFLSFCMMLLVSLLEIEIGEGLRVSASVGSGLEPLLCLMSSSL